MRAAVGWLGGMLLAFCGVPQAWTTVQSGDASGLSWMFLLMWLGGEVCLLYYSDQFKSPQLYFNYALNILCILIIIMIKV